MDSSTYDYLASPAYYEKENAHRSPRLLRVMTMARMESLINLVRRYRPVSPRTWYAKNAKRQWYPQQRLCHLSGNFIGWIRITLPWKMTHGSHPMRSDEVSASLLCYRDGHRQFHANPSSLLALSQSKLQLLSSLLLFLLPSPLLTAVLANAIGMNRQLGLTLDHRT